MPSTADQPLPLVDDETRDFWTSGERGVLRFCVCGDCGALIQPPRPVCRYCRGENIDQRDVAPTGVIVGFTVNHQQWDPRFPPPFVIATIAIDADPRVRVISNIVDVDHDEVHVGMHVRARFEQHADVWIPLFVPTGEPDAALPEEETPADDHRRWVRPMPPGPKAEDRAVISGVGQSAIGRRLMRDPLSLAVEAINAAVADAGLTLADIDGLSTYPGSSSAGGFSEGGITAVEDALGIRPAWYNGGGETFGPGGSVMAAMIAVAAGVARHVVCFRTVWQATYAAKARAESSSGTNPYGTANAAARIPGFNGPYGLGSAANNLAMYATNHMARYGTTRETLGWIALNQRANAGRNPKAIYRDPMTMDDYLEARLISTPFGLYDCDVPADACTAVVVSSVDTIGDLAKPPVRFEAVGTQITERIAWEQSTMSHEPQVLGPAAHLWSRTTLTPADVDVALLYDGFTFNCLSWLEGLGFCGIGEAKDFLEGGHNIAPDGIIPVNPHGGQLSAGRTHGMGFVHEAVVQLRGEAGERQIGGARVAVVTSGGLTPAGVMLLRAD